MEYKIYSILRNWYNSNESESSRVMLVRHFCKYNFLDEININEIKMIDKSEFVFYKMNENEILLPYEPFLSWIKNKVLEDNINIEEFINNQDMLYYHKNIIRNYFLDGSYVRQENSADADTAAFASDKMSGSIASMINTISLNHPVIFAFDRLHCANESLISVINKLLADSTRSKVTIIAGYNIKYPIKEHVEEQWDIMIKQLEKRECIFESSEDSGIIEMSREWNPDFSRLLEYFELLRLKNEFEENADLLYYLDIISKKISQEKLSIPDEVHFKILDYYIRALIKNNKYEEAKIICEQMNENVIEYPSDKKYYIFYKLSSIVCLSSTQSKSAVDIMKKAVSYANKLSDERIIIEANSLLKIMFWFNNYFTVNEEKDYDGELVQKLEKYELYYQLTFFLTFLGENKSEIFSDVSKLEERTPILTKALNTAKMLNDNALVCRLYSMLTSRMSAMEQYGAAIYYGQKWVEYSEGMQIERSFGIICMGYNNGIIENYQQGHDYYLKAFHTYYGLHDTNHMTETLYNMAINAMMAQRYAKAVEFLNTGIEIMHKMSYYRLFACNIVRMYAVKAICSYRLNKMYMCVNEFRKIERNIDDEIEDLDCAEDAFYYHYIKGIIEGNNNNRYDVALECFDKAEYYFHQEESKKYFSYIQLSYDRIRIYMKMGDVTKARQIANEVAEYCDSKSFEGRKRFILSALTGGEICDFNKYKFDLGYINVNGIIEITDYERKAQHLKRYYNERKFIVEWQKTMSMSYDGSDRLITKSITSFLNNYELSGVAFIRLTGNEPEVKSVCSENDQFMIDTNYIINYFLEGRQGFATNANDNNYDEYSQFARAIKGGKTYSLFAAPFWNNGKLEYIAVAFDWLHSKFSVNRGGISNKIDVNDIEVYISLYLQLISSIERVENSLMVEKINRYLYNSARTDALTNLLNRKGMFENFEEYISKISGDEIITFTVIYMDLDNFKHYNDNYGHKVGDVILSEFANVIYEMSKDKGFAARYGGDEFIVILNGYDRDSIIESINNIYRILEESKGFEKNVSNELGMNVVIGEAERLSCSMGITKCELTAKTDMRIVENAINNADEALYQVKNNGKRSYIFI